MVKTDRAYEQEILIRLKNGDTSAMRELYALYGDYVYTIAYSFTLSESDSAEISQDVFLKIWKSAKAYDENRSSLRTWIARIAKNTSIDKVRKKNPEPAGEEIDLLLNNIPETITPEDELLKKEESKRVKDALNKLERSDPSCLFLGAQPERNSDQIQTPSRYGEIENKAGAFKTERFT